jgi:hypothetical protein
MRDPKYKLREGKALTGPPRSLINVILRKHLGDAKVVGFLFNQPIPRLLDLPMQKDARPKALLQNMLEEFMNWHASLLQSLIERNTHPAVVLAHKLSDLDQHEWQKQRRKCKIKAKQRMDYGAFLVKERDSGKRKFDDMSATEQQTLEDFENLLSRRVYEDTRANKPPLFRGRMLGADLRTCLHR